MNVKEMVRNDLVEVINNCRRITEEAGLQLALIDGQYPHEKVMYCPHCGTNSAVNTIRCQTEYPEFSIFTCYNCGKTHIREVKEDLLVKACASHPTIVACGDKCRGECSGEVDGKPHCPHPDLTIGLTDEDKPCCFGTWGGRSCTKATAPCIWANRCRDSRRDY